jgi:hypothetical protein
MYNDIDELASIQQAMATLEATASKLKARIKARGLGLHMGEKFYAEVLEYDRAQLNTKMVKEMVDETIISACTEIKHIQSINVKEIQPNGNP